SNASRPCLTLMATQYAYSVSPLQLPRSRGHRCPIWPRLLGSCGMGEVRSGAGEGDGEWGDRGGGAPAGGSGCAVDERLDGQLAVIALRVREGAVPGARG